MSYRLFALIALFTLAWPPAKAWAEEANSEHREADKPEALSQQRGEVMALPKEAPASNTGPMMRQNAPDRLPYGAGYEARRRSFSLHAGSGMPGMGSHRGGRGR